MEFLNHISVTLPPLWYLSLIIALLWNKEVLIEFDVLLNFVPTVTATHGTIHVSVLYAKEKCSSWFSPVRP